MLGCFELRKASQPDRCRAVDQAIAVVASTVATAQREHAGKVGTIVVGAGHCQYAGAPKCRTGSRLRQDAAECSKQGLHHSLGTLGVSPDRTRRVSIDKAVLREN